MSDTDYRAGYRAGQVDILVSDTDYRAGYRAGQVDILADLIDQLQAYFEDEIGPEPLQFLENLQASMEDTKERIEGDV